MSALPAGHPALRFRLAEAMAALFLVVSAREIGRWIGRKGEVVPARGDSPDAWPLSELLVLGEHDAEVRDALRAYIHGEQMDQGQAVSAAGDLLRDLTASASFISTATQALGDGRITSDEATALLSEIRARRAIEDEALIPSLRACMGAKP